MKRTELLEVALRNDRVIVAAALTSLAAVAWVHMLHEAQGMDRTGVCECLGMALSGPDTKRWAVGSLLPLSLMWVEMMVAMMIPSAAPMILIFAQVNRRRREQARPFIPTSLFVLGYLGVWSIFGIAAAAGQWVLHGAALLSPMMKTSSAVLGGVLLIAAGVFQWTPWKRACLRQCSSPLSFLLNHWREGKYGALVMGVQHGAYCTGCCGLLMALLFVAGVMNMWWVAAITLLVALEKAVPHGRRFGAVAGLAFTLWGMWLIASPWR